MPACTHPSVPAALPLLNRFALRLRGQLLGSSSITYRHREAVRNSNSLSKGTSPLPSRSCGSGLVPGMLWPEGTPLASRSLGSQVSPTCTSTSRPQSSCSSEPSLSSSCMHKAADPIQGCNLGALSCNQTFDVQTHARRVSSTCKPRPL